MIESLLTDANPRVVAGAIVLGTLVSEDLTCVAVALLLAAGRLDWLQAIAACCTGIVLGDFGVWLLARWAGARILTWPWLRRRFPADRVATFSEKLCRHGPRLAIASRLLPGARLPLFLAAGLLRVCPWRFLGWTFAVAVVWTPLFIAAVAALGHALPLWLLPVPALAVLGWKVRPKLSHHEFWPAWLFYLPLVPWFLLLSLRYRSFTVWTAANPVIPAGGVVGESKAEILSALPDEFAVPTHLIPSGDIADRLRIASNCPWPYPWILKPDAGQRGAGVRKIGSISDVRDYLESTSDYIIAQPYHPGPFEVGVFYYRLPGQEHGRIFSITDKIFPVVVGDGRRTLESLIRAHPRYSRQVAVFLARHADRRDLVLAEGREFPLALAGNHCQGTLLRDGSHWRTPALEYAIDAIARQVPGFHFGRFDIRFTDAGEFRRGHGFAILELNGVTSESTNIYDPSWSVWRAYCTLFRQWAIAFRIGSMNRDNKHAYEPVAALLRRITRFYRDRTVNLLAD
jgi:membrane protein DedA with SNARE-associated domain